MGMTRSIKFKILLHFVDLAFNNAYFLFEHAYSRVGTKPMQEFEMVLIGIYNRQSFVYVTSTPKVQECINSLHLSEYR